MKLFLTNRQSPGDILMITSAVRDLKASHPNIQINVDTTAMELWENNPHLDRNINRTNADKVIVLHYPIIHKSTQGAYHFIHGFRLYLEEQLNIRIPSGDFCIDIHLSEKEKGCHPVPHLVDWNTPKPIWIVDAGYKIDFTCKMWEFNRFQRVVDETKDEITWVQIGASNHVHKPLKNVINLIGKTSHREFIHLMYYCKGVLTPVSYPMHLATMPMANCPQIKRPCVVIAGSREPSVWEAYTCHTYLHNCGVLPCSFRGACWKSRIEPLDVEPHHNKSICLNPVVTPSGQKIPKCLDMIAAEDVVKKIRQYLQNIK